MITFVSSTTDVVLKRIPDDQRPKAIAYATFCAPMDAEVFIGADVEHSNGITLVEFIFGDEATKIAP